MKDINTSIQEGLTELEHKHNVRILFAVETGSRAWGFASPDSDYDVRFLYAHSTDWYLSIKEERDVIEWMPDKLLDYSGWDIRKALRLFGDSNPSLLEWLQSDILYRESTSLRQTLRALAQSHHSRKKLAHHYLRMAEQNYAEYIEGKDKVRLKKYLYVIRPLIVLQWMSRFEGLPPIALSDSVISVELSGDFSRALDSLLNRKSKESELGVSAPIADIDNWIKESIPLAREYCDKAPTDYFQIEELNRVFQQTLIEVTFA